MPGPHFSAGNCGSDSCDCSCDNDSGGGGGGDNDDVGDVMSSFNLVSNLISMICVSASRCGAFSSESSEKSSSDVIKLWRFFSKFDKLTVCCNGLKFSVKKPKDKIVFISELNTKKKTQIDSAYLMHYRLV